MRKTALCLTAFALVILSVCLVSCGSLELLNDPDVVAFFTGA